MIDSSGRALLCDFGLSRIRHAVTRTHTSIQGGGRDLFIPPELSEQEEPRPNEAGDIYTFAMTILELGTGEDPFEGEYDNVQATVCAVQTGCRPQKPLGLAGLTGASLYALWSLMERMWAHRPTDRPPASTVLRVTWRLADLTSRMGSVAQPSEE